MKARTLLGTALASAILTLPALATPTDLTGRFLYEDRVWDFFGYTGGTQDLPIRHADVEAVDANTMAVLGSSSTDANGDFTIDVDIASPTSIYIRCLSAADNHADYHVKVVDTFVRSGGTVDLSGSTIYAITSATMLIAPGVTGVYGQTVIVDNTGSGVAQAFNIFDNGIDAFDYLATGDALGSFPTSGEFVVFGWDGTTGSGGSNYFWQGIFITSTASDTDGWSDAVILHEVGHWVSDLFGADDNPGGQHFLGDSYQDPRLSYGEGYATFIGSLIREFRSSRLNDLAQPIDDHVSIYADLAIPPAPPTPGGLEFSYDFETGFFSSGNPISQFGTASETNVTSALWDVVDGTGTPDETPGSDDDSSDDSGSLSWDVTENYMPPQQALEPLTVEDFYAGWFVRHGTGFNAAQMDEAFVTLADIRFFEDGNETNENTGEATIVAPATYTLGGGSVVISELELGAVDAVELQNVSNAAVDMTNWRVRTYRNNVSVRTYTFGSFTLYPGCVVVVYEFGNPANNGPVHVFGGSGFSVAWFNTDDGACTLENGSGTAVDFVRWDNVSGSDPSTTPVPAGQTFTGSVFSPFELTTLGRDGAGTDTDDATDFTARIPTLGAPNFDPLLSPSGTTDFRGEFAGGDVDLFEVSLTAGDLLAVHVNAIHSAGRPSVQILDAGGSPLSDPLEEPVVLPRVADVQFIAEVTGTYFVKVENGAPFTESMPTAIVIYERPDAGVLRSPIGLSADPANAVDVADDVDLAWVNAGLADSIRVRRDGILARQHFRAPTLVATLPGSATDHLDQADRGLYTYEVSSVIGATESSPPASRRVFAGTVPCFTDEDFESGTANLVIDSPWALTNTISNGGTFSITDSPGGNHADNIDVSVEIVEPAHLIAERRIEFDHICITEAEFDFGHVEISEDWGNSWTRVASYDMDDHPEWNDGVADPGDWKHEVIDLSSFAEKRVRVRFRLISDPAVNEDGWYIDNVTFSDPACTSAVAVDEPTRITIARIGASPNPFTASMALSVEIPIAGLGAVRVFDPSGRLVRTLVEGALENRLDLVWDGRGEAGHAVAPGVYFVRVLSPGGDVARRVVKLR